MNWTADGEFWPFRYSVVPNFAEWSSLTITSLISGLPTTILRRLHYHQTPAHSTESMLEIRLVLSAMRRKHSRWHTLFSRRSQCSMIRMICWGSRCAATESKPITSCAFGDTCVTCLMVANLSSSQKRPHPLTRCARWFMQWITRKICLHYTTICSFTTRQAIGMWQADRRELLTAGRWQVGGIQRNFLSYDCF